ncbi:hypothetical protein PV728_15750 [Streptomyces europaeiscabiei]|uniref:hypothetical protein n=1 Tax=Streptomyces TaxID=1883 RepID=UPI0015C4FD7B|nr:MULTISPECIES: hypothetical protein [Streptomyces]MDX3631709.1 hypothetical protein [Streptomyces europaeiscabiei]MDX3649490.1 hypothetical protein [Streptomyces europaeiscabiei]WUD34436.1 hypothetical protein OG858_25545 [Streptomyces europaeiscabiei]
MTAGWGSRTTRAAMFAAVCVLLAALGHVMMSGSHVPWWTLVAGAAATGAVGWCLAGRERGLPLITSVVVAAQTALHWGFELAQSSTPTAANNPVGAMSSTGPSGSTDLMHMGSAHMIHTVPTGAAGHMGHVDHTGYLLDGSSASSSSLMSSLASMYASSSGMFAAHLLAALLCGLWLAYGERAAFGLLRAVAGWLAAPLRLSLALPVAAERPRPRVRSGRADRSPRRLLLVHAITSRGPPAGTAVI